jgi:hypothetical protein
MTMFASKSIVEHLLRGLIGIGAIVVAVILAGRPGWLSATASAILALSALVAFRGCPVCWSIGLFETIGRRIGRSPQR